MWLPIIFILDSSICFSCIVEGYCKLCKDTSELGGAMLKYEFSLQAIYLRVRFFGKIQIRILVSKNGFCVSLPKSENGLIMD